MKEKRQIFGKQYFRATLDKNSINKDARTVDVVFVTERQVLTFDWDIGIFFEVLPCNDQEGDLSRLNNGAPLCDTHDTSSIKTILGVVERAWFDNGVGRATVRFSKRADVDPVWHDVQDGIITGISVGYLVHEYEEIGVRENLPLVRANKWEGTEISLAPVQADVDSGVGRAQNTGEAHDITFIRNHTNFNTMTEAEKAARRKRSAEILKACRAAKMSDDYAADLIESDMTLEEAQTAITEKGRTIADPPAPVPGAATEPNTRKLERARINDIRTAGRMLKLEDAFLDDLVDREIPIDQAREAIINEAARRSPVEPKPQTGVTVGTDEKDKKQKGMEASLLQRAGVLKADQIGDPGEYAGMNLMDLAKECLEGNGVKYRGMLQREIAQRALQMSGRDGGGAATGDFGYVLQNVMNKTLRMAYDLQVRTFTPWSRKSTATDFKAILRTQLNDITLSSVQEGGEYQYAKVGDSGEKYSVAKFGRIVRLNWEAVINDDLSAFSRYPTQMAGAVAQMQGDQMYTILTGSEVMGDTFQLFDATNHLNLISSGTELSVASLAVARQMFRTQKSPGGSPLNLTPKFLIVGPAREFLANQMTSNQFVSTKSTDINPFAGALIVIVDARITGNAWYLVGDPMAIDTAEYGVLDGQEIFTETKYGFNVDALEWKVRSIFGKKAIEWRSFFKNVGV